MSMNISERAKAYAEKCHRETNHLYDGKPYTHHLEMVVDVAEYFSYLIAPEHYHEVIAACWCHDVIEDTRQTYNDVKKELNETVANIAYALTNEKGRTRKERANSDYYYGIKATPYAVFVKVCDRIANTKYSKVSGSSMLKKYQQEHNDFVDSLYDAKYDILFKELLDCTAYEKSI